MQVLQIRNSFSDASTGLTRVVIKGALSYGYAASTDVADPPNPPKSPETPPLLD